MTDEETLTLASDTDAARRAAELLFHTIVHDLTSVLPQSAEILHVGATAIPDCLTKGDLDIVVRVDRADFNDAQIALAERFRRNSGSMRTDDFAAFEDSDRSPHLGIQLTAKGGELDVFHIFTQAMCSDPDLVRRYNELKLRFRDQPMPDYRAAKNAFVAEVLSREGTTAP